MAERGPMTAREFRESLLRDPEYVRSVAERKAELERRRALWAKAQRPMLADLAAVGVSVDSVWDLVGWPNTYDEALPVLARHLESGDYPDRVLEGIARAMAMPAARPYRELFMRVAERAEGSGAREGAFVALAACSTAEDLPDLERTLGRKEEFGELRVHLVRAVFRLDPAGFRNRVAPFLGDEEIAPEVQHWFRRKRFR